MQCAAGVRTVQATGQHGAPWRAAHQVRQAGERQQGLLQVGSHRGLPGSASGVHRVVVVAGCVLELQARRSGGARGGATGASAHAGVPRMQGGTQGALARRRQRTSRLRSQVSWPRLAGSASHSLMRRSVRLRSPSSES